MADNNFYTVSGLTMMIKTTLDEAEALRGIWVRGEISNFTWHSSGHMYFTLKDPGARLRCVMFRTQNRSLRFRPADGMEVLALGSISVFERSGEYQLYVEAIEPAGLGALHLSLAQLRERLAKEGLFDANRKRPLPIFPRQIALVTSPSGAAVHDLIKILRQRQPGVGILVVPVLVQGPEAAASIAAGLAAASVAPGIDLIITGRGGGSPEELWPFNEEQVVRAIVACRPPVIAAVGHEVDVTLADLAADARAATPSAAAEMAVPDGRLQLRSLVELARRIGAAQRRRMGQWRSTLARLAASPVLMRPERLLAGPRQTWDENWQELVENQRRRLTAERDRLAFLLARLDSLSPLSTLRRGYAICRFPGDGRIIRTAATVLPGSGVEVILHRGRLACTVTEKEESDERDADA